MEEKNFKYAERAMQIKKVNTFLCISTSVVFLLSYIIVIVSFLQGNRTALFAGGMLVVMLATIISSFITLKRDSGNERLRWYIMIGLGFFCGILVYLAVEGFKKIDNNFGKYVVLILSIGGFIVCGFEHSIANMFYYFLNGSYSLNAILSILLCVLGNSIGGVFIPLINKLNSLKGE